MAWMTNARAPFGQHVSFPTRREYSGYLGEIKRLKGKKRRQSRNERKETTDSLFRFLIHVPRQPVKTPAIRTVTTTRPRPS